MPKFTVELEITLNAKGQVEDLCLIEPRIIPAWRDQPSRREYIPYHVYQYLAKYCPADWLTSIFVGPTWLRDRARDALKESKR